jgi:hypothetical protein
VTAKLEGEFAPVHANTSGIDVKRLLRLATISLVTIILSIPRSATCEEVSLEEARAEYISPIQRIRNTWEAWPPSREFKINLEYRNYSYFHDESRGDGRDSMNEGRVRVEYDRDVGDNTRAYVNALLQADDAHFTHGFMDDFEDDDLKRNYFNLSEAFLDIYFDDFDLRLGKQMISWGKADAANPTNNINPSDFSNLLDDDDIGVVAVNLNYYWRDWGLQLVGVPGFTPTRLPPRGTRFALLPDAPVSIEVPGVPFPLLIPVEDPELPSNTPENSQFGVRAKTTYRGWDFSLSYYDGVNDLPAASLRFGAGPFPVAVVPVYNRFRAMGTDFATTVGRWGIHGEAAQLVFDGEKEDSRIQYVIGCDYKKSDILFDHDLFVIFEYIGEHVNHESESLDTGASLDSIFKSAFATNVTYGFTEYTKLEVVGIIDVYQGDDYYVQPQLVHEVTDDLEITAGLDLLGGPSGTFFGEFKDNDRVFVKLKYTF